MVQGEGSKQRKAFIKTRYENPTKENWLSFCVGRRNDLASKFWSDDNSSKPKTYTQYIYIYIYI